MRNLYQVFLFEVVRLFLYVFVNPPSAPPQKKMPCLESKHDVKAYVQSPLLIINILLFYVTEKLKSRCLTVKCRKTFLCCVSVLLVSVYTLLYV